VSVAFGAEYRNTRAVQRSDALSLANAFFLAIEAFPINGDSVKEAYAEFVVPLAKNMPFLEQLELNGAVRLSDYRRSGTQTTWKVGVTYAPFDDLRLRFTRSRDIRAPNIDELGRPITQSVTSDPAGVATLVGVARAAILISSLKRRIP